MYTFAVIALESRRRYRPALLSSHLDEFGGYTAFRAAPPPAVLVRLHEESLYDFTVLTAKGVAADALEADAEFRAAVRRAVRGRS